MSGKDRNHIELENFWPYQAVVLADQISRHTLSIVKAEAGLNLSQWRVLAAVAEKPGRTARDVTDFTPMDKTIVSRAVSSLIKMGLIKKTPDKRDKRQLFLVATPKGRDIYENVAAQLNIALIDSFDTDTAPDEFLRALKAFSLKMRDLI